MKQRNRARRIVAWAAALVLGLSGCSVAETATLESHTWYMTTAQSTQSGDVVAYNPNTLLDGAFTYADCTVAELTCRAADGQIVLENATDGTSSRGTYQKVSSDPETTIYRLMFAEGEGTAVISVTKYNDGTQKDTLVVTVGDHTLYFQTDTLPAVA